MARRLDGLTGLRGAAAIMVVLWHFNNSPLASLDMPAWFPPILVGFAGVDLFFVLSGFVISLVHLNDFVVLKRAGIIQFLALRLARIYPLYLLTLAFMAAVTAAAHGAHMRFNADDFRTLPEYILLVQAWHSDGMHWNYPAWSLSAEWFLYLLFPFLAHGIAAAGPKRGMILLAAAVLILGILGGEAFFTGPRLIRATAGFLLGILCYLLMDRPGWQGFPFVFVTCVALVASFLARGGPAEPLCLLMLFAILVLACAHRGNVIERVFSWGPLEYAGQISYALYLIHAPIQKIAGRLLLQIWHFGQWPVCDFLIGGAFFAAVFAAAHIVYQYFELPARRRLRALIGARRSSAA